MSITFYIPTAPTKQTHEVCLCSQFAPSWTAETPDWEELREHAWTDCSVCKGAGSFSYEETAGPRANFANENAYDMLIALGLPQDFAGTISPQEAPELMRKAIRAINVATIPKQMARPGFQEGNYCYGGTSAEAVRMRFQSLMELFKYAVDHNQEIVWG
jgi:hypothetical protein